MIVSKRLRTISLVLALAVAVGFAILIPLSAYAHGESIGVQPSKAMPGDSITITGMAFEPGQEVTLSLESARGSVPLGNTSADNTGSFSVTVTVPADVSPGSYQLTATTTEGKFTVDFVVTGTSTGPGEEGTQLLFERSQAETIAIGIIAAALIAAGTVLVLAGTQRRG